MNIRQFPAKTDYKIPGENKITKLAMPRVHRVMLVQQGLQPPAHDAGGKLTQLQVKAKAVL